MTDSFSVLPLGDLLNLILKQYDNQNKIFGISKELFFNPTNNPKLQTKRFGVTMDSPIGVAAGPQTQLAQNIVAAWLTGARFIELKTIQTLDELDVSKPCIDMQDEGYNCEWSQELKIHQSFEQYLDAWIIIHILKDKFNWNNNEDIGVIFNMSVGYNLEGILNDNVQWFFNKMKDASAELQQRVNSIRSIYPNVVNLKINPCISNNITLSTMHGCPADEIETIGEYLIDTKKLHTAIKLNPTLLGKEELHKILSASGFETDVPDIAFEHDLLYPDAISIIKNLQQKADNNGLQFSVKLTNTLESNNNKDVFSKDEPMMYMSGKALHPISINLAAKLQNEFGGKLDISFSGGADAFNIADIVDCGLSPVTVCSDLLKPGGYGRLHQYINNLVTGKPNNTLVLDKLNKYAKEVLENQAYKKTGIALPSIKTNRKLNQFDCINAPCVDTCPTNQGIPDYLYYTSKGEFEKAAEVILETNPFPHSTGMVCDHLCQTKCTRINYDNPLQIREIKRFIAENYIPETKNSDAKNISNNIVVSIIGAGPSGLSCAYFLAKAGMQVNIYESKSKPGGMVDGAIPSFRLTDEAIDIDINSILNLGVNIVFDYEINKASFTDIKQKSDYIYIGTGAKKSKKPDLQGINSLGVLDPLDFLFDVKQKKDSGVGTNVVIIGGGNTAMDAARTAYRLVGENGKVTIVYRRTIKQMPADLGEIRAVIDEGIDIVELASPTKIVTKNGRVVALRCNKMKLGSKDASGRATPGIIPNSEFEILMDTLIPAIGQEIDIDFATKDQLISNHNSYETKIPNVFIGGDAMRGASTAINAIGDGRKAAQEIIDKAGINFNTKTGSTRAPQNVDTLMLNKATRIPSNKIVETDINNRKNFNLVTKTLTEENAIKEASRCLLCDEVCNICTTVCPNLAFHSYQIAPVNYNISKIISKGGNIEIVNNTLFKVEQSTQILHITDWCNQCGNCNTFCPTSGAPYLEKPHLYLNIDNFNSEKDGYYFNNDGEFPELLGYFNNHQNKLKITPDYAIYENENITAKLELSTLNIIDVKTKTTKDIDEDLTGAAQLAIIIEGAISFFGK